LLVVPRLRISRRGGAGEIPIVIFLLAGGVWADRVSLIRRGERTPHPRHWQTFIEVAAPDTPNTMA
jgi:hypothetical protein